MRKRRARWHQVAVFALATALIPASACSSDKLYLAYYLFQSVTDYLGTSVTDTSTTSTTDTTTSDTTTDANP